MPYRDSKLTRLIASGLGGGALALPVLHLRADRFEEAEAVLTLCPKLPKLSASAALVSPTISAVARSPVSSARVRETNPRLRICMAAAHMSQRRSTTGSGGLPPCTPPRALCVPYRYSGMYSQGARA